MNGKIRAREVRVIDTEKKQLGVMSLSDALNLARVHGVDLVEIAPNANPPVCRLVDFGKYRYELAKQEKESRKNQHANKVKEIQISPSIDQNDFSVKCQHAIGFLCEDMKVKISLRFRGREMAHKEFGFQAINRFVKELAPYGHLDAEPKLIGKGINVMLTPLPKNKRAKNPHQTELPPEETGDANAPEEKTGEQQESKAQQQTGFANNAFADLDLGEKK